jgi:excisionase family DNA binding protein
MDAKEYQRQYYLANRERILARQKKANEKRKPQMQAYQAQWEQDNRDKRNEYAREQYQVTKLAEKQRLAESDMIGPTEAASMLGITLRSFRQWTYDGKVPSTKSPTGRVLIKRADIEALKQTKANGKAIVKAVKASNGFTVPEGFDLITTYKELTEYTEAFAKKQIGFLLLVGSPGSGKSQQMKGHVKGKCTWIDNHVTNLGLYCSVYEASGKPVVLDDVNHFLQNKIACSLIKALTQTDEVKCVSWESTAKALEDREVPRNYTTTSPVCLIANMWDASNADYVAIQDRSLPVAFYPSAETIHARVVELGWCKDREIVKFIADNLASIPQPSMREYYLAGCYKRANMDWRKKLFSIWEQV